MTTTFTYSMTTDPPVLACSPSANAATFGSLLFVISNPTSSPLRVSSITFSIMLGSNAISLSPTSDGIIPILTGITGLDTNPTGGTDSGAFGYVVELSAQLGVNTPDGILLGAYDSFSFAMTNIQLSTTTNTSVVTVVEEVSLTNKPSTTFTVSTYQASAPTPLQNLVVLGSSGSEMTPMAQVARGQTVTLQWQSTVAEAATVQISWTGLNGLQTAAATEFNTWTSPPLECDSVFTVWMPGGTNQNPVVMTAAVSVADPDIIATEFLAAIAAIDTAIFGFAGANDMIVSGSLSAATLDATTLNATTLNATTLNATTLNATTLNATSLTADDTTVNGCLNVGPTTLPTIPGNVNVGGTLSAQGELVIYSLAALGTAARFAGFNGLTASLVAPDYSQTFVPGNNYAYTNCDVFLLGNVASSLGSPNSVTITGTVVTDAATGVSYSASATGGSNGANSFLLPVIANVAFTVSVHMDVVNTEQPMPAYSFVVVPVGAASSPTVTATSSPENFGSAAEPPVGDGAASPAFRRFRGSREHALRLASARVAYVDYDLIRADFCSLRNAGRAEIEEWLIEHAAVVSRSQAAQSRVNTAIETAGGTVEVLRPQHYGRAVLVAADDETPIDVKGAGVGPQTSPDATAHGNGLLNLAFALREVVVERVLRRVFEHAGAPYQTVRHYGILAANFEVREPETRRGTAALLLRRAYPRPEELLKPIGSDRERMLIEAELLLRRYGITSSGPVTRVHIAEHGDDVSIRFGIATPHQSAEETRRLLSHVGFRGPEETVFGINIQVTGEIDAEPPLLRVVDYCSFLMVEHFDGPLAAFAHGGPLQLGTVIRPDDPRFIQPDPRLRIPYDNAGLRRSLFGASMDHPPPFFDTLRIAMDHFASEFVTGNLDRDGLQASIDQYVLMATEHLDR